jgi:hypothetical protein
MTLHATSMAVVRARSGLLLLPSLRTVARDVAVFLTRVTSYVRACATASALFLMPLLVSAHLASHGLGDLCDDRQIVVLIVLDAELALLRQSARVPMTL